MKKTILRLAALCLALALALGVFCTVGLPRAEAASTVATLEAKQKKLNAQIKALEKELSDIKDDRTDALKQKNLLSSQIDAYLEDIADTNALISLYEDQIAEKEQLIKQNTADYDALYEALKARIRVMQENGDVSYLEVLLTSRDLSDLLTRSEIVNRIVQSDKNKLRDLLETRASIESAKHELEITEAGVSAQKAALVSKKNELAAKQKKLDTLLSTLSREEADNKKNLEALEAEEAKVAKELAAAAKAEASKKKYVGGDFAWPLPSQYTYISSPFGMRNHPITHVYKLHTGVDISRTPKGTTIMAANDGKVIRATYSTSYGNYVMIDHGGKIVTLYAHMSKMSVKVNDQVSKGQKIGEVGSTGYSTGNHLHFEIIINGTQVDPMKYFTLK